MPPSTFKNVIAITISPAIRGVTEKATGNLFSERNCYANSKCNLLCTIAKIPNNIDEVETCRAVLDSFWGLGLYKIPVDFLIFQKELY